MADDKQINIIREQGEFFEPVALTPEESKTVAAGPVDGNQCSDND